ncbi:hypothetical protein AN220_00575 [Streptomyces nanshensis]|nr:hypothetical protein AN220_00575 [Streptomyces nanshensis]
MLEDYVTLETVGDLIRGLREYADGWQVRFEHVSSADLEAGEAPEYEYTIDMVILDLDTNTVRLMSIGEDRDIDE